MLNLKPFQFIILCAAAGGLGWGIRGQYGHESGATMAASLVSFAIGMGLWGHVPSLKLMRAISSAALVAGFGGSMTYGQTLGLTQDTPLIGNWNSWSWGMLGVFIKGGLWIAFFGLFLGAGLSRENFKPHELAIHAILSVFILFTGVALFNEPFNPNEKILPYLYFSDHWRWEPDSELSPRRERWGGLLLVLIYWIILTRIVIKQILPMRLALFGFLFGGIGFCVGQAFQSFHAWNPEFMGSWNKYINWWNFMETIFGAIWGGGIAIGVLSSKKFILNNEPKSPKANCRTSQATEWIALFIMSVAGLIWNIGSFSYFDYFADLAWTMIIVPLVLISFGSIWPFLWINVIVLLPIAAKTIREMSYAHQEWSLAISFVSLGALPVIFALSASLRLLKKTSDNNKATSFKAYLFCTLGMTWIYFLLNFIFFRSPWIWSPWTSRTPNAVIFLIFAVLMTCLGLKALESVSKSNTSNPIDQD